MVKAGKSIVFDSLYLKILLVAPSDFTKYLELKVKFKRSFYRDHL
jgi:hypothetical protein